MYCYLEFKKINDSILTTVVESLCVPWKCGIFVKQTFFLSAVAPPSPMIGLETKHTVVDETPDQNNDL